MQLEHKEAFTRYLAADPPLVSELTFTNLFIWRHHYRPHWAEAAGCLVVICATDETDPFGLPPIGPDDKSKALEHLVRELSLLTSKVTIHRAPEPFIDRFIAAMEAVAEEARTDPDILHRAPGRCKVRRLDETAAARKPCLAG